MSKITQALIIVDVEGTLSTDEFVELLPDKRDHRVICRLRDHGAPAVQRSGPDAQPVDWSGLGRAVEAVAQHVRREAQDSELHLYVGGQGPLPVFTHLGYAFSKFSGGQWFIGRKSGEAWKLFPLGATATGAVVLTAGSKPTSSRLPTGKLAVYVDIQPRPANPTAIIQAIEAEGDRLADIVELRPSSPVSVDPSNISDLASELVGELSRLPGHFPNIAGVSLFVAGPTVLAYATGRAINPNIIPSVWLTNLSSGTYEVVYALPFQEQPRASVTNSDQARADRARVESVLGSALAELKTEMIAADLEAPLRPDEHAAFLARLASLKMEKSTGDEFSLHIATGTFSFGEGLLEALRNGEQDVQVRFAKLLLVHELFHEHQGIRTTNYFDVGRAGVVLESVDFTADLFALRALTKSDFRRNGDGDVRGATVRWLDAILYGIEAFDLLEHGPTIKRLADRRLRRYLTWHLQRARGETVSTPADVEQLLGPTLTAELAPVAARVDPVRFDREVVKALPGTTEFFAAIGGRLIRHSRRPGFDPGDLIEAVRGFNRTAIQGAMRFVIGEDRPKFVPWRP